jgi:Tol biopolymer transport system component
VERTVSVVARHPTVSVEAEDNRNSKLVFQSGSGEIWAMNALGSEPVRLTEKGKEYPTTSLSPDGKKIAYASSRTEGGCGGASACASTTPEKSYAQIYVMNTDGSDQTQLMEDLGTSSTPTWSPDGKTIAFALFGTDDESCTIYAMNANGSGYPVTLTTIEGCYSINSLSWSPDGKKLAFEGSVALDAVDIWVLDVAGAQRDASRPRQLTHTPVHWWNVSPTWSPDSTEIAFTHKHTMGYEENIHKINADGSGETRLTRGPDFYGDPADPSIDPTYFPMHSPVFSPDGEKIAFVRGYQYLENPDPYSDTSPLSSKIYVMGSDGTNPTVVKDFSLEQVTNLDWVSGQVDLPLATPDQEQVQKAVSSEPTPSTDDCKSVEDPAGEIAYDVNYDIWTMNADGTNPTRLTHDESKEYTPVFSPDGQKIAFVKEVEVEAEGGSLSENPKHLVQKVVVMDANGCNQVELPVPEGKGAYEPFWSPDGRRIAFWFLGDCGIFVTTADGSGTPRPLPTPGVSGCAARPEWSPDGTQIAFEGYSQDGWADIYLVDVTPEGATSRPKRLLTDDTFQEVTQPSWSPDGTEIAFSGSHSGYHAPGKGYRAIFKIDVNSLEETRLTKGSDTETSPTWSPDGEKIAYVRDTSDTSSIYMVGSDGSAPTLARVFPSRDYPFGVGPPDWRPPP